MQRPQHATAASFGGCTSSSGGSGGGDGRVMAAVVVTNWPRGQGQAALMDIFRGFDIHPNGLQLGMHGPEHLTDQGPRKRLHEIC
mmetsp:Transcript_7082/g.20724  ORF Transcript_7082/g.20724 Transcript_7082/m.20724 type:complete len:85 (-) Transcript_7082:391-645(-)